jgi:hypothetical protein
MAGGINGVTVLFRLLSEDNVSGALNKIYGNVDKLEGALGKTNITAKQLESAMKEAGAGDSFNKVKTDLEGTTTAAGKLQADLKKVEASMKDAGDADKFPAVKKNLEDAAASADKTTTANGKLAKSFDGIKLAAGAALTGAGMYMEGFVQTCLSASITIQANNQKIGGSMGLTATQTIAATPQINSVLSQVQDATGRNINDLREIMPMVNQVTHGNMGADATSMESISALAYAKPNSQPSDIATIYNKMVTSGSPMALGQFGLSLTDMGTSTKAFKDMNQDQRRALIDQAINSHLGSENANMADTTAGRMAIFQGKLETFEGKLGDTFVPFLTGVLGALTPMLDYIENHSIAGMQLSSIAGGIVLVGTALTLLAGPILALQGLGIGKIATELWAYAFAEDATGDAAVLNAPKLAEITTAEDGLGGIAPAAVVAAIAPAAVAAAVAYLAALTAGTLTHPLTPEQKAQIATGQSFTVPKGTNPLDGMTTIPNPNYNNPLSRNLPNANPNPLIPDPTGNLPTSNWLSGAWGNTTKFFGGMHLPSNPLGGILPTNPSGGISPATGAGDWLGGIGSGISKYFSGNLSTRLGPKNTSPTGTVPMGDVSAAEQPGMTEKPDTRYGGIFQDIGNIPASVSNLPNNFKKIVGQIPGIFTSTLGKIPGIVTKDVSGVPKIFTSFLGKVPGEVGKIGQNIETDFWNGIKGMGDAVNQEIADIKKSIQNAPGEVANVAENFGHSIYTAVVNKGMGKSSPGLIYKGVVEELGLINGVFIKHQSIIGNSAADLGTSMVSGFGRSMGNVPNMSPSFSATAVHTHYHAPITIDASHMNEQQLMELMIKLNENTLKPNAVPTVNKQTTPTTPSVSTTTPNTSTPSTGGT